MTLFTIFSFQGHAHTEYFQGHAHTEYFQGHAHTEYMQLCSFFTFFVLCIVTQLCNVNQHMHTFQINVLIQFLASSTCFEHHVFIIRKTIGTCSFVWYIFLTFM